MTSQQELEYYKKENARLEKEVEFYNQSFSKVAKSLGVETELQLITLAENNEETYIDLLIKYIRKHATIHYKPEP